MRLFYYVHTGHRVGLDRFRRACTIIRALGDVDITLLCSDFRIAAEARHFGVAKAVGIDAVQNIPQIAVHGDKMIFDSDEANPIMLEDMRNFFSTFIRISDAKEDAKASGESLISPYLNGEGICTAVAVDAKYFEPKEKNIEISYFFGDDDYEKDLEKNLDFIAELNPDLQLGFYYFLDYEEMLRKKFPHHHEFEDYDDVVQQSKILITASPQAVLESLASGAKPIYVQREDHPADLVPFFESLHIPIVYNYKKEMLMDIIRDVNNKNYFKMEHSTQKIANFLKETLNL